MRRTRPLSYHCACCRDRASPPLIVAVHRCGLPRRACQRALPSLGAASRQNRTASTCIIISAATVDRRGEGAERQPANVNWTPAKSIEDMDKGGVAAAMISITNPGLWFGDKEITRRVARECNEYGAKLVQEHPTRFGLFAALPLPDVDATLKEIEYAFDTLKADGAHFMTSYGDTWLGSRLPPVMGSSIGARRWHASDRRQLLQESRA
jgi:hypothetical protein